MASSSSKPSLDFRAACNQKRRHGTARIPWLKKDERNHPGSGTTYACKRMAQCPCSALLRGCLLAHDLLQQSSELLLQFSLPSRPSVGSDGNYPGCAVRYAHLLNRTVCIPPHHTRRAPRASSRCGVVRAKRSLGNNITSRNEHSNVSSAG